ncbi:ATP-binding cassette domain-containing protein [Aurantimonas aggregata]|uniref:ATP-binding cassette domain-containing protein n=2 Tax=Aurantimonas aggregata TaxID=2047720 RepID=A0A6L9MFY6_9HYPH|nr:ATP-binding cassette domain-containing protein [Aurantimonas aggregata]
MTQHGEDPGRADASTVPALVADRVERSFGAVMAIKDVSITIAAGERRAILGPNGAGKTTLFNTICGDYPPTGGRIMLFGEDVTTLNPHRRARLGIGRTYQSSLLFTGLTVLENLYLGVRGAMPNRLSLRKAGRDDAALAKARRLAEQVRVDRICDARIDSLSHGQRRQVEVGMALACDPRLLMLDEPAAGLSAAERPELVKLIGDLPRDLTLILIEHDMDVALPNCDIVTVMKDGEVVVESTPDRIADDPVVQAIYLGGGH